MGKEYDKVIKENMAAIFLPLSEKYLGIKIATTRDLPEKLQSTIEREPDFVKVVADGDGKEFILHWELQTKNETDMVYRMAEYRAILQRKYKLTVRQFVFYIGQDKLTMKHQLEPDEVIAGFSLTDVQTFDPERVLASSIPEEIILGVLGDYPQGQATYIIQRIISRLQELCHEPILLQKYTKQLTILSRLRKLEIETKEQLDVMAITYDIYTDGLYLEGKKEGKKEGKREGIQVGIDKVIHVKQLLNEGLSEREVSRKTRLSLETVRKIVAAL